ncbi:MAG: hypothetical protein EOO40_00220 [Deltaproteobacteria bacterium]|nr:MAG: hypothetical protein EOO40_00220 [Deltaproteobacteria bacterium]
MTPKQADAKRLVERGCSSQEIQTALRLLYGTGIHTSELASIRRGDKEVVKAPSGTVYAQRAQAPEAPAAKQLSMPVAPPAAAGKSILLKSDGTWRYVAV